MTGSVTPGLSQHLRDLGLPLGQPAARARSHARRLPARRDRLRTGAPHPLANPVLIAIVLVGATITLIDMPVSEVLRGRAVRPFPARNRDSLARRADLQGLSAMRGRMLPLLAALLAGGVTSIVSAVGIARLLGADSAIMAASWPSPSPRRSPWVSPSGSASRPRLLRSLPCPLHPGAVLAALRGWTSFAAASGAARFGRSASRPRSSQQRRPDASGHGKDRSKRGRDPIRSAIPMAIGAVTDLATRPP